MGRSASVAFLFNKLKSCTIILNLFKFFQTFNFQTNIYIYEFRCFHLKHITDEEQNKQNVNVNDDIAFNIKHDIYKVKKL